MLDSLQPLFWLTGYMVWFALAILVGFCALALFLDYGWRSLRWLFGLPRGSSIWEEPRQASSKPESAPEPRFPSWTESEASASPEATPSTPEASRVRSVAQAAGEVPTELPTAQEPQ